MSQCFRCKDFHGRPGLCPCARPRRRGRSFQAGRRTKGGQDRLGSQRSRQAGVDLLNQGACCRTNKGTLYSNPRAGASASLCTSGMAERLLWLVLMTVWPFFVLLNAFKSEVLESGALHACAVAPHEPHAKQQQPTPFSCIPRLGD